LWARYQAKIWWPNLDGLEDAPATANRGEAMKVRAAVCMVGSVVGIAGGGSGGLVLCEGIGFGLGLGLRDWNRGDPLKDAL
jgi:hypothetical protein